MKPRQIHYDELDKLLELYKFLNPDDPNIGGKEATKTLWDEIMNNPDQSIWVIDYEGSLVATCTLVIVKNLTRGGRPYGLIENVVTHGDYRKMGFGRAVLEKAIETAKKNGCYKVMLMSGRKDEGVLSFYEKVGFERGVKTGFCIKF